MNKILKLILCIALTLLIGVLGGLATAAGVNDWYLTLNKPAFNPPNYLFGPVWTLLYILMGIGFYLVLQSGKSRERTLAVWLFCVQLFLNLLWSFIFFKLEMTGAAFIEILVLLTTIVIMIATFFKVNRTAAYLQIPYVLWVSFASILTGFIWVLN